MVKVRNWGEEGDSSSSSVELYFRLPLSSVGEGSRRCRQSASVISVDWGSFSEAFDLVSAAAWAFRAKLAETRKSPPRWAQEGLRGDELFRALKEDESSSSADPSIEALFEDKSKEGSNKFCAHADSASSSMSKEEDTTSSVATGLVQGVVIPEALLTSYPWVHYDVLATPNVFTKDQEAHLNEVVQILDELEQNKLYRIVVPEPGERPCFMATEGNRYMFMFDYTLTTIGIHLPFSDFIVGLINHLRLVPSQIHPVA